MSEAASLDSVRRQAWQQLAAFRGTPGDFWQSLAQGLGSTLAGELAILYAHAGNGEQGEDWRPIAWWPGVDGDKLPALVRSVAPAALADARRHGLAIVPTQLGDWRVGLLSFQLEGGQGELIAAVHLGKDAANGEEAQRWLAAYLGLPRCYELGRALRASERDAVRLAEALELIGRVHESPNFDQAALAIVNELSLRFACETVSLAWRKRDGLHVRAISHAEKVDRRSEVTALLEEAGQEALAQEVELAWPGDGKYVTAAHERYAALQHPGHLFSLPLLQGGGESAADGHGHLGVLVLERQKMPMTAAEQWALRMLCDLLTAPLQQLEKRSRPLYRRLGSELWQSLPSRFKPATAEGRRFAKQLAIALALVLLAPLPYSVDAGAQIKTDAMAFVGAPFDGFIESSPISLGVPVKSGDLLFTMATRELALERAGALADMAQYAREAEKRRSANQLPEMQIAEAQHAQAEAKLRQINYRLENAEVRSPIDGVVVEGEPGKNLGGAVRRGESIVKVAALSGLYVEAAVREKDLSRVEPNQSARLSLLADPGPTYDLNVKRVIPAASVKDGENTFAVRLHPDEAPPAWWRPGMNGVAKISVGWRPLIWIATHRLVDYLRLVLWF